MINKEELLSHWVKNYLVNLKPKLLLGRFIGAQGWWYNKSLDEYDAKWGGEVGAYKLNKYLKPEISTIYLLPQNLAKFVIDNRLQKSTKGNVEIYQIFWISGNKSELVHPILIYSDLIATNNQRNVEDARMIYNQYVTGYIK